MRAHKAQESQLRKVQILWSLSGSSVTESSRQTTPASSDQSTPKSSREVFDEVEPLMSIIFSGCDFCIFTDGQSGSGKS